MSELNNKGNTYIIKDNIKKKLSNEMLFWILFVFTLIMIITTVTLIYLENHNKDTYSGAKNLALTVKLTDTYHENPLNIAAYYYLDGVIKTEDEYYHGEYNLKEYNKQYRYVQIKGLKNKEIENKINNEIMQKVLSLDSNNYKQITAYVYANFANILSVYVSGTKDETVSQEKFNYRLDTGEKIKFEDLFTSKEDAKIVLSQAIYNQLAKDYVIKEENYGDISKEDYSIIEMQAFEIMNDYNNNAKIEFCITPERILAEINNRNVEINMIDFYQYIAIYKRYLTKQDLYESNNQNYEMFVFSEKDFEDCFYSKLEEVEKNLFVEIDLYNYAENEKEEIEKIMKENMEKVLEKVKQKANISKDEAYYLYYSDTTSYSVDEIDANNPDDVSLIVMNKNYYNQYGKEAISFKNRNNTNANIEPSYETANAKMYFYINGEFVSQEVE